MLPIFKGILSGAEDIVKNQIDKGSDEMVSALIEKAKALIPGQIDDAVWEGLKPSLLPKAKEVLMNLADKIDGEVG